MELITPQEMYKLEERLFAKGITVPELMEHVGKECAGIIEDRKGKGNKVIVFCGPGNNGGDGLVCARYLAKSNDVVVVMAMDPKTDAGKLNLRRAQEAGIRIIALEDLESPEEDIVVDALLGIGASGPLRGDIRKACDIINSMDAFKISIDVPTGAGQEGGIRPDATLALHLPKAEGGEVWIVDMGLGSARRER
jgi:NAD(P)H-hydrate epimerase